jgi:hypothetical protein
MAGNENGNLKTKSSKFFKSVYLHHSDLNYPINISAYLQFVNYDYASSTFSICILRLPFTSSIEWVNSCCCSHAFASAELLNV